MSQPPQSFLDSSEKGNKLFLFHLKIKYHAKEMLIGDRRGNFMLYIIETIFTSDCIKKSGVTCYKQLSGFIP